MTIIRPNSITGITSVTAQGGNINVFRADGTAGDLTINNIVGAAGTFTGNLNVGGVLTYEDVTNIDSVGVITARSGIRIGATGANTLITGNGTGIGIGITTPTEELHIRAATPVIRLEDGDNARQSQIVGSDGNLRLDADNNNAIANTNIAFRTDGVERLRIASDGDTTISNSSTSMLPNAALNIISDKNVESGLDDMSNYHLVLKNPNNDTGEAIGLAFGITDTTAKVGAAIIHERDAAGSQGSMKFFTRPDNAGPPVERVRITSTGRIGIGTDNPDNEVEINGQAKFTSGGDVDGPAMLVYPHPDVTLANNASTTLNFPNRFTGLVVVNGKGNDTPAVIYALASASAYASDGATRLMIQNHPASNISDLTITSPSHGGTYQYQLNQTGSSTKTYKIFAFGIFGS